MANKSQIEELRELARKRHKAATRKLSRLKAKGVNLAGTRLDPRRNAANIKRYTAKQLTAYLADLNHFTARTTQFAPGTKGKPLTGNLWQQYKSLETKYNALTRKAYEAVKDTPLPSHGDTMTIEALQAMKPLHPLTGNPASRAPHIPINRSSTGVPDDRAIRELIKDMKNKLRPDYQAKVLARNRETAAKMLEPIHDKDISRAVSKMSDANFFKLWGYTKFADIASFDYLIARSRLHGAAVKSWHSGQFKVQINQMKRIINDIDPTAKIKVDEDK